MGALDPSSADLPQILLLQGVDGGHDQGHQAADVFGALGWVEVETFEIGGLGRGAGTAMARATKVIDLARLRVAHRRLHRLVEGFAPHLVYSAQQRWDQRIAVRLAELTRVPRVVHLHYTVGPWLGSNSVRSLMTADQVLAVSDFIREDAIAAGVRADRIFTVRNPARRPPMSAPDARRPGRRSAFRGELSISENALVVGMVGRLCPSKGQLELLDAVVPLLQTDGSVHLVFAGGEDPPGNGTSALLRRRAACAGVAPQVHLLGHRRDIPAVLDGLDLFAHPSRFEPFGLAMLEAMAHGLPVVAWEEGGAVEVVSHLETGILVTPMDLRALTEAISGLLADAGRRKEMGDAGRARVRNVFRADDAAQRFVELLDAAAFPLPCQGRPPVRA
jgi:glycosyltransferase involved in cell wall biosynthesis